MRRAVLFSSLPVLLFALCILWQFRFESLPDSPTWRLVDLQPTVPDAAGVAWTGDGDHRKLKLSVEKDGPPVALRIAIPGVPEVESIRIRFQTAARGLVPGVEEWSDGRLLVEWHPVGDVLAGWENDPVSSHRFDDGSGLLDVVARPRSGRAIPALRIENLGTAGDFEVSKLEITVVRERWVWKIGRFLLALAWFVWVLAWIHIWPGIRPARASLAAIAWVLMGIYFAIPGPWKIIRPLMGMTFQTEMAGNSIQPPTRPAEMTGADIRKSIVSEALPAMGKIPDQGDWVLRVKHRLVKARPFLHVLLFFGPSLFMVWWVGRQPTIHLMMGMAMAIELAQVGFGYGFGWEDVLDLCTDGAGVLLAIWVFGRIEKWRRN